LADVGLQTEVRNGSDNSLLVFIKAADEKVFGDVVFRSRYDASKHFLRNMLRLGQNKGLAAWRPTSAARSEHPQSPPRRAFDRSRTIQTDPLHAYGYERGRWSFNHT
jgi:hypothetical protein